MDSLNSRGTFVTGNQYLHNKRPNGFLTKGRKPSKKRKLFAVPALQNADDDADAMDIDDGTVPLLLWEFYAELLWEWPFSRRGRGRRFTSGFFPPFIEIENIISKSLKVRVEGSLKIPWAGSFNLESTHARPIKENKQIKWSLVILLEIFDAYGDVCMETVWGLKQLTLRITGNRFGCMLLYKINQWRFRLTYSSNDFLRCHKLSIY